LTGNAKDKLRKQEAFRGTTGFLQTEEALETEKKDDVAPGASFLGRPGMTAAASNSRRDPRSKDTRCPEKQYLREEYTEMAKAKSGSKGTKKGTRTGAKRALPRKVMARITNVGGVGTGLFSFGSPAGKACKYTQSPAMSKDQARELMVMNYYNAKAKVNEKVRDLQRCMCLKYGSDPANINMPRTISKPEAATLLNFGIQLENLKSEFSAKCMRINFKFD
jgi:hypothetical protein